MATAATPNVTYFVLHNRGMQVSAFTTVKAIVESGTLGYEYHSKTKPLRIEMLIEEKMVASVTYVTPTGTVRLHLCHVQKPRA